MSNFLPNDISPMSNIYLCKGSKRIIIYIIIIIIAIITNDNFIMGATNENFSVVFLLCLPTGISKYVCLKRKRIREKITKDGLEEPVFTMTVQNFFKERVAINSSIKLTDRKAGHFYRYWTQTDQSRTASGFLAWTPLVKTKESLMSGVACDFYDYFHHQNKIQKGKGLTFIGVYEQFNCTQYFDLLFGHADR